MHAIGEVDVGRSGRPVERLGADSTPMAVGMARRIVGTDVRLYLHDPAGGLLSPAADLADEDLAQ